MPDTNIARLKHMADYNKPNEKNQQTDEERRKAAAKTSAQNPSGNRGTQVHATPNQPTQPKEGARGTSPAKSFEQAGRAVRAQPPTRQDPANQRKTGIDEDTEASSSEDDQSEGEVDEDADDSDRMELKTQAQQTADEEER